MKRTVRSILLVGGMLPTLSGCYRYAPVETVQRGMDVRAQLTSEAAVRRSMGRDEPVLRYDGLVVSVSPDSLALDMVIARASSGLQDIVIRDTVMVSVAEIQAIMHREISVGRTVLLTAAAGAAAVAVVLGLDQIVGGTEDLPPDITPNMRAPLFSWRTVRLLLGVF